MTNAISGSCLEIGQKRTSASAPSCKYYFVGRGRGISRSCSSRWFNPGTDLSMSLHSIWH